MRAGSGTPVRAIGLFAKDNWSSSMTGPMARMQPPRAWSPCGVRSSLNAVDGHYDRTADIAWLRLDGWNKDRVRVERTSSRLVERDRTTGRVVGLEYWEASRKLPSELLEALPAPPRRDIAIERQLA
jgi:uncharacterized protein YuzE